MEKVVKPPQKPTIQNAFKVSPHSMLSSKRAKIPIKKPPDIFIERMTQGTAFRKHNESKNLTMEPIAPPRPTSIINLVLIVRRIR